MDTKEWDKRLARLLVLLEKMAATGGNVPPVINVNVTVGDPSEGRGEEEPGGNDRPRRRRAVSSPGTEGDVPAPGGMPRPWVS